MQFRLIWIVGIVLGMAPYLPAQTDTTFTYQGRLSQTGGAANGNFDMEFRLFSALSGGGQVAAAEIIDGVAVNQGLFTVELDFGADAFSSSCWLEIVVEDFILTPRLPLNRTPFAVQTRGIFVNQAGAVGMGTGNPEGKLHVMEGSAGVVTAHGNSSLVLERLGDNFLSMLAPTSSKTGVLFGRPGDPFGGGIVYNENGTEDGFEFRTGGNQKRMILTDDGKLGVGNFDPSATLSVSGSADPMAIFALNASEDEPTVDLVNVLDGFALTANSQSDASPTGGGVVQIGAPDSVNIAIDHNEIMARNNGETSTLYLNANGGDIRMGSQRTAPALAYGRFATQWNGSTYDFFLVSSSQNVNGFSVDGFGTLTIQITGGIQDTDVLIANDCRNSGEPIICRCQRSGNDLKISTWGPIDAWEAAGDLSFVVYRP